MEVKLQLKIANGSVASSLGYETAVDAAVKDLGLRMYPLKPGTQDSKEATLFRVPVEDPALAERLVEVLTAHEGVASAHVG